MQILLKFETYSKATGDRDWSLTRRSATYFIVAEELGTLEMRNLYYHY
jgi:hypothetical protein